MNLLFALLIGVGIGTMVELLPLGHHASELALAMLLGAAGSLVARYVGEIAGFFGGDEPAGFIAGAIGAIAVLLLYGAIFRRTRRKV